MAKERIRLFVISRLHDEERILLAYGMTINFAFNIETTCSILNHLNCKLSECCTILLGTLSFLEMAFLTPTYIIDWVLGNYVHLS